MKPLTPIIRKLKRKKSSRPSWSDSQTARYKELVGQLEHLGFVVRREELKRGHCWKVLSGACRSLTQRYIFVDSRLSPDEQVAFLTSKVSEVNDPIAMDGAAITNAA